MLDQYYVFGCKCFEGKYRRNMNLFLPLFKKSKETNFSHLVVMWQRMEQVFRFLVYVTSFWLIFSHVRYL